MQSPVFGHQIGSNVVTLKNLSNSVIAKVSLSVRKKALANAKTAYTGIVLFDRKNEIIAGKVFED